MSSPGKVSDSRADLEQPQSGSAVSRISALYPDSWRRVPANHSRLFLPPLPKCWPPTSLRSPRPVRHQDTPPTSGEVRGKQHSTPPPSDWGDRDQEPQHNFKEIYKIHFSSHLLKSFKALRVKGFDNCVNRFAKLPLLIIGMQHFL